MTDAWIHDCRYALRTLRRSPAFSVAAILVLALGIGATTAVFTLVRAALRGPLGVAAPASLVTIEDVLAEGSTRSSFSHREYVELAARAEGFSSLAAHQLDELSYRGEDGARVVQVYQVSGNYFATLGLRPALGRFFDAREAQAPGAAPVVVVSHAFWRDELGREPGAIGRTIHLNGQPLTVIGVAPERFNGVYLGLSAAAWVPLGLHPLLHPGSGAFDGDNLRWLRIIGRLADGVSIEAAQTAAAAAAREIPAENGGARRVSGARVRRMTGLPPGSVGAVTGFLALLLASAGLVLAVASVNVAGMLLARATARGREISLRLALGASRARLFRQLLIETVTLFAAGAVAGSLLAVWLSELLRSFHPPLPVRLVLDFGVDGVVLLFALGVSLACGIIFGLTPAAHAIRLDLAGVFRQGGGAGSRQRARSTLLVAQLAACVVLLVAAGQLVGTTREALSAEPGFAADRVAVASLDLEPHGYTGERATRFFETLLQRLREAPSVEAAAVAEVVPLGFSRQQLPVEVPGTTPPAGEEAFSIGYNVVDDAYFETMRIGVRSGRPFRVSDRHGSERVAVVNETMAARFWPDGDAVGRQFIARGERVTVVGVVRDVRYRSLREQATAHFYVPFAQHPQGQMMVHVRGRTSAGAGLALLRREVAALDPDVPLVDAQPLSQLVALSTYPQRLAATLIGVFGGVALLLATVGLYGLLAFSVTRRTREFGIRFALGADRRAVGRVVISHALRLGLIGVAIGGVLAAAALRAVGRVIEAGTFEPLTFAAAASVLLAVIVIASWLPARRAARVDPVVSLREE